MKKGLEFGSLDKPVPKDMPVAISAEIAFNEWREEKAAALPSPDQARRMPSGLDQSENKE